MPIVPTTDCLNGGVQITKLPLVCQPSLSQQRGSPHADVPVVGQTEVHAKSVHLELDRPLGVQEDLKSVEVSELDPFGIEIGGPSKSRIRCGVSDITLLAVCQKACLPFRPVPPPRTPSRQQQHVLELHPHRAKR